MNNSNNIYRWAISFKKRYPSTVAWRLKKHAKIIEKHLNPGEKILYAFSAQKNDNPFDIVTTYAVVLTNKRIMLGSKRVLFGYFFTTITPELFNDLKVNMGLVWGKIYIDTIKESSRIRYKYYGTGIKYTGTIFTDLRNGTISDKTQFYKGMTIDETVESSFSF